MKLSDIDFSKFTREFSEIPDDVGTCLAIWFEPVPGEDESQVWFGNEKKQVKALEDDLKEVYGLSHRMFSLFYDEKLDEDTFFEYLSLYLNSKGLFTYNSDCFFEIYDPKEIEKRFDGSLDEMLIKVTDE